MTLVATWVNLEPGIAPSIWTAADTKISDGKETIMLEGSKVFELPLSCRTLGGSSYGNVYYKTSLGFSYAGSSMIGLNTYATLCSVLSNLGSGPPNLPDHISIVNKAKDILKVYTISVQSYAEISIWGFCPITHLPFIGVVSAVKTTEVVYTVEIKYGYEDQLYCSLIGSHKSEVNSEIAARCAMLANSKSHDYWRTPIKVLRDVIKQNSYEEIGGNIQLAIIPSNGSFNHFAMSVPVEGISPRTHTQKYRNIDQLEEIGRWVGNCLIAIPALEIDFPLSET
ncbi:hypothetical protein AAFN85_09595 [Mucilaginibacter sp. CAU 1740]|uniref:hypothetical protein n=1 Tax=Mucilaginibacter sp. CAU 1740 TaxID=3140365 RepID=UPI00325BA02C